MFKRLPSTSPAPDRASLRKLHNSGRNALSATFPLSRRSLLLPCALGLLMSAAMLACGSDDTQQQPGSDQPAAAVAQENTNATASTSGSNQPEQSSNDGRNTPAERTAPERERENDGASGDPTATTPPTATTAPTPTPEPTATPAPTPTPDPRVSTMELLTKKRGGAGAPLEYTEIHNYNRSLITEALAEPLLDAFIEALGEQAGYQTRSQNGVLFRDKLQQSQLEFERIESDSPELHVKVTVPFVITTLIRTDTNIEYEDTGYQITGNAVFELTPTEDSPYQSVVPSEATHAPTFSRFTSEPVMAMQ